MKINEEAKIAWCDELIAHKDKQNFGFLFSGDNLCAFGCLYEAASKAGVIRPWRLGLTDDIRAVNDWLGVDDHTVLTLDDEPIVLLNDKMKMSLPEIADKIKQQL